MIVQLHCLDKLMSRFSETESCFVTNKYYLKTNVTKEQIRFYQYYMELIMVWEEFIQAPSSRDQWQDGMREGDNVGVSVCVTFFLNCYKMANNGWILEFKVSMEVS